MKGIERMTINLNNPAIFKNASSPGVLFSDHYHQSNEYKVTRSNGAKEWIITFTLSGEGLFSVDGHEQHVKAGELAILKPKTAHQYGSNNNHWEFYWAHFLPRPTWIELLNLPETTKGFIYFPINDIQLQDRVNNSFQRMIRDNRLLQEFSLELSMNALEEILLAINQWLQTTKANKIDYRVQQVIHLLNEELREAHTIQSLADQVCLSPSRLSHLFREQVGTSIMATLLSIRLAHAAKLLEFTQLPISEIANEVGFASPFYFTKQFTTSYGMNPSAYRKRLLEQ
ncbi:helix-turn-helix domain-containing protein [Metabacillus sp. FJAT-53654]|uniref:Helix-turn-helix domain-containing protein n=1 Tax=Metabacillus rhizosphaerae TaxID=3117747 RepID=A0ABZ2MNL4_9BACI